MPNPCAPAWKVFAASTGKTARGKAEDHRRKIHREGAEQDRLACA